MKTTIKFCPVFSAFAVICGMFAATLTPIAQAADVTIVKAAPRTNTQIAIVPFAGAESISGIVANDLTNLGQFALDSNLPERPKSSGEVTLPVWQHQGVPYLVVGNTRSNRGDIEINFEVIEVGSGRVLDGVQRVSSRNTPNALRLAGHKVADRIYELLTGVQGDFSGKIVYVVENGTGKNRVSRLIMSDVDGYNPEILREYRGTIKSLNPSLDGKSFTYTAQGEGYPVVYASDVVSKSSRLLTPFRANNFSASISPDGSRVLFSSDKDGNPEIYLSTGGGAPQRLTNHPMADIAPSWAPDGQSFLFTSDRNGNNRPQIYRYRFATRSIEQVSRGGSYNTSGRISSDGKKMSFLSGTQQGAVMDLITGRVSAINNAGLSEAPSISPNGQHLIYSGRNVIIIKSEGKTISINPHQNGVPAGVIREPIWLKGAP